MAYFGPIQLRIQKAVHHAAQTYCLEPANPSALTEHYEAIVIELRKSAEQFVSSDRGCSEGFLSTRRKPLILCLHMLSHVL